MELISSGLFHHKCSFNLNYRFGHRRCFATKLLSILSRQSNVGEFLQMFLWSRGILVIATPYASGFDHFFIADEVQFKFDRCMRFLHETVSFNYVFEELLISFFLRNKIKDNVFYRYKIFLLLASAILWDLSSTF